MLIRPFTFQPAFRNRSVLALIDSIFAALN
jgi:hypothetical protein